MLLSFSLYAQELPWADQWNLNEESAGLVSAELEGQQWRLDQFRKKPLDLNQSTAEELAELGLLDAIQIAGWIRYRQLFGAANT